MIRKIFKLIINFLKGQMDNLHILIELLYVSYKAAKTYSIGYRESFRRGFTLARSHHFRANEALELGLYSPDIDNSEFVKYASKRRLSREQAKVNPASWFWVTESKDIFYRFCMMMDIPIPKIYAIYYQKSSGWTFDNGFPCHKEHWVDFVSNKLPETYVIKPAKGVYGHGLNIYTQIDDNIFDNEGNSYTSESLIRRLKNDKRYEIFIIQERLTNHYDIKSLCESDYLQTFRINSFIDNTGKCRVVFSALKLITGTSIADNFEGGTTGNLVAKVDLESGTLFEPHGPIDGKPGYYSVNNHPKIKCPVKGFKIPLWRETCKCVEDAASKFLPIRSIGWDVAITPQGPVIVEANIRWDPMFPNMYAEMGEIIRSMQEV